MSTDLPAADYTVVLNEAKPFLQANPFMGYECVLKKCCKKYKKGKRCKKCPD